MPAAAGQWTGCHDVTAHVSKSVAVSQIKKNLFLISDYHQTLDFFFEFQNKKEISS
jgi:hypothetical protein